jgi:hypothetical protein
MMNGHSGVRRAVLILVTQIHGLAVIGNWRRKAKRKPDWPS